MTEDRKYAILFAATLLAARRLNELDPDKPSPAKMFTIDKAISQAKQLLDEIDNLQSKATSTNSRQFVQVKLCR